MEITEQELEKLLKVLIDLNNDVDDMLCTNEDRRLELSNMLVRIELMQEILTTAAQQAKESPS